MSASNVCVQATMQFGLTIKFCIFLKFLLGLTLPTSDFQLPTSDFRLQIADFQTSDLTKFELRISDF